MDYHCADRHFPCLTCTRSQPQRFCHMCFVPDSQSLCLLQFHGNDLIFFRCGKRKTGCDIGFAVPINGRCDDQAAASCEKA